MNNDYIKLLESLELLVNEEEFEININIPVTGTTYKQCISLNKEILMTNNSPIVFSQDRLIYPHVTLKMGKVNINSFLKIVNILEQYTEKLHYMLLEPKEIILKSPENNYYFSEINDERLLSISKDLDDLLGNLMSLSKFTLSKNNLHHITLGYKCNDDLNLASVIGKKLDGFIADRIHISIMGDFGVCIGCLKTFYLNGLHEIDNQNMIKKV